MSKTIKVPIISTGNFIYASKLSYAGRTNNF
jgi:hypothetical protein